MTETLLQQLHSSLIAPAAAAQALKNLLWLCLAFLQHPALAPAACRPLLLPGAAAASGGDGCGPCAAAMARS